MRKVIIFLVFFVVFDRFMNYLLDFNKKNAHHKSRLVLAHTKSVTDPRFSLSKKNNKNLFSNTLNTYKRMFLATFMKNDSSVSSISSSTFNDKNYSSNRNA